MELKTMIAVGIICFIIIIVVIVVSAAVTSKSYSYKHTIDEKPETKTNNEKDENEKV